MLYRRESLNERVRGVALINTLDNGNERNEQMGDTEGVTHIIRSDLWIIAPVVSPCLAKAIQSKCYRGGSINRMYNRMKLSIMMM